MPLNAIFWSKRNLLLADILQPCYQLSLLGHDKSISANPVADLDEMLYARNRSRNAMKLRKIPEGIEHCLENGKRLLDDARLLKEHRRYRSAIPLYVLGYEEMGKAIFLFAALEDGKGIDESEFRSLTRAGSHLEKTLIDYDHTLRWLRGMSDEAFEETRIWFTKIKRSVCSFRLQI